MARKDYSEEFRRQAVDLYESTPGATVKGIASDLGIVRGTLKHWIDLYGAGKRTAPDGATITRPVNGAKDGLGPAPTGAETPEQKIARLQARVKELEVETGVEDQHSWKSR